MTIKNIVFDLGGVLVDWDPRYMYRKIFETEEAMDYFLANVCTFEWNEQQDGGRIIKDAEDVLIAQFPQYTSEIKSFYGRWEEMLGGPIQPSLDVLKKMLESKKYDIYALTNWSAETWPRATQLYDFLNWFKGVLVSGQENLKKPDPKIFHLLCEKYSFQAEQSLFIDDNLRNIEAAKALGFNTVHFSSVEKWEEVWDILGESKINTIF